MLSRRQLRVKVMQALYAWFQNDHADLAVAVKELQRSIEKVYDLYLYLLLLLPELAHAEHLNLEDGRKRFSSAANKQNELLSGNPFINALSNDATFKDEIKKRKILWQKNSELIQKTFLRLKKTEEYNKLPPSGLPAFIIKKFVLGSELFLQHVEETNIYWKEDLKFVTGMVMKTISVFFNEGKIDLQPLYKDDAEDKSFVRELFTQTIKHNKEYEQAISEKTKNWEVDRIAVIDIILMKMSIAEIVHFPTIPIKVSLNEYIDISKDYSTPSSKQFINGVIDKIVIEYKSEGKLVKTGRGLIES